MIVYKDKKRLSAVAGSLFGFMGNHQNIEQGIFQFTYLEYPRYHFYQGYIQVNILVWCLIVPQK